MTIDTNDNKHIIADEGKVFKRIEDDLIFGNEIYLGYTWYINGIKLDEPKEEKAEDFEEIDKPEDEEPIDYLNEEAE
jgi:hypothetical protein